MPPLTTPQLESLHRLLIDPLRDAVRTEMQAGHDRLTAAIEKVADRLSTHTAAARDSDRARDARTDQIEKRLALLERFRTKVLAVCAVLSFLVTLAWSILHDYLTRH